MASGVVDCVATDSMARTSEKDAAGSPAAKAVKIDRGPVFLKKEKDRDDKTERKERDRDKDKKETYETKGLEEQHSKERLRHRQETEVDTEMDHRKYFKPGQKFLTPPVSDATRAFYESLLQENPESKIAVRFCIEYGVFSLEVHQQLLKQFERLKEKGAYNNTTQITRRLQKHAMRKIGEAKKEKKEDKGGKDRDKGKYKD